MAQERATCHRTLAAYPRLAPGAQGRAVRTLQCVLNDAGFGPVTVDGDYGAQTRAAVKRVFGTFEGVVPKPYVVKHWYWTLLFARSHRMRDLHEGSSGVRVRSLQRALRADGASIVVDGDYGPQTAARVRAFQRGCNLGAATGRVNDSTAFFLTSGGCGS